MIYSIGAWTNSNAAKSAAKWKRIKEGPEGPKRTGREVRRSMDRFFSKFKEG